MGIFRSVLIGTLILNLTGCGGISTPGVISGLERRGQGVIYGEDSVVDVSAHALNASSSFALVSRENWEAFKEIGEIDNVEDTFGIGVADLRWGQQISLAFCSGVLIASDQVLTAGHCFSDGKTCENTVLVRNYRKGVPVQEMEAFSCESIPYIRQDFVNGLDYAVVKVQGAGDAAVAQKQALALREGSEVYSLGYPLGSPLKKADGKIRSGSDNGMIVATLDVFEGNSGSPIYSKEGNKLVGILSSGESDFNESNSGDVELSVRRCSEDECTGEFVVPIEKILADIKNQM